MYIRRFAVTSAQCTHRGALFYVPNLNSQYYLYGPRPHARRCLENGTVLNDGAARRAPTGSRCGKRSELVKMKNGTRSVYVKMKNGTRPTGSNELSTRNCGTARLGLLQDQNMFKNIKKTGHVLLINYFSTSRCAFVFLPTTVGATSGSGECPISRVRSIARGPAQAGYSSYTTADRNYCSIQMNNLTLKYGRWSLAGENLRNKDLNQCSTGVHNLYVEEANTFPYDSRLLIGSGGEILFIDKLIASNAVLQPGQPP